MERALLESALFAHVPADEIRKAISKHNEFRGDDGNFIADVSNGEKVGPFIWPWMAAEYDVTCAICHCQFMWHNRWNKMDLGHFCQKAIPRHKPIALKTERFRSVLTPLCDVCRFPLFKAGCSNFEITEDKYILGLCSLVKDRRVRKRIEEWADTKLRIDPLSTPAEANEDGHLVLRWIDGKVVVF
jgi:hypothetical protein